MVEKSEYISGTEWRKAKPKEYDKAYREGWLDEIYRLNKWGKTGASKFYKKETPNLKEVILKLRAQKKTYDEIASELGCAKSTVSFHCKNNNITDIGLKYQVITDEIKKEIIEFTRDNTIADAVKKFGIGRTTIIRHMKNKTDLIGYVPTEEDIKLREKIYEYSKTHTLKHCAMKLKVSITTVRKYAFKKGRNEISDEIKVQIVKLRKKHSIMETADKLGISIGSVKKFTKKIK